MTDEEKKYYKDTTGFNTPEEYAAFEEGYLGHEKIMMEWIEKWQGNTNSALGELLYRKYMELREDLNKI